VLHVDSSRRYVAPTGALIDMPLKLARKKTEYAKTFDDEWFHPSIASESEGAYKPADAVGLGRVGGPGLRIMQQQPACG